MGHNAVLVGGTSDPGRFQIKLERQGVKVLAHIPFEPVNYPKDTTAVIILKSHCSHSLFHAAKKEADKDNLLVCTVDQLWSSAYEVLLQHGIIELAELDHEEHVVCDKTPDYRNDMINELSIRNARLRAELEQVKAELEQLRVAKKMPSQRYTSANKRSAVHALLQNPECVCWSDRAIADMTSTSHTFVSNRRKALGIQVDRRLGNDGRMINVKKIGKGRKGN